VPCCIGCAILQISISITITIFLNTFRYIDKHNKSSLAVSIFLKISQYLSNNHELRKVLGLIREFRDAAGLVINTDKSEILELGNYKYCVDIGITLVKMAKITGIWFSEDYQLMSDTNWNHVRDNVFGKLARWKNRQLTLIGKSVIVSSQLLPIIMFTGTVLSMPASMNQEFRGESTNLSGMAMINKKGH
jgi:hypothetical protein